MNEIKTVDELIKECEDYLKELKTQCVESMFSREYSWRAKCPFKVSRIRARKNQGDRNFHTLTIHQ